MQFMQVSFTNIKERNLDRSLFHPLQMRSNLDNSSLCNSKTTILFVLLVRRGNLGKSRYKPTSSEKSANLCKSKFDQNYQNSILQLYIVIFIILSCFSTRLEKKKLVWPGLQNEKQQAYT